MQQRLGTTRVTYLDTVNAAGLPTSDRGNAGLLMTRQCPRKDGGIV